MTNPNPSPDKAAQKNEAAEPPKPKDEEAQPVERHEHAVIKPPSTGVTHTDPGGTIHIG